MEKESHDLRLREYVLTNSKAFLTDSRLKNRTPREQHHLHDLLFVQWVQLYKLGGDFLPLRFRHVFVGKAVQGSPRSKLSGGTPSATASRKIFSRLTLRSPRSTEPT